MSAERYEITDREDGISITSPDGIVDQLIASDPEDGTHLDDAVIGAIRQQARDIAELRAALILALDEIRECDDSDGMRGKIALVIARTGK